MGDQVTLSINCVQIYTGMETNNNNGENISFGKLFWILCCKPRFCNGELRVKLNRLNKERWELSFFHYNTGLENIPSGKFEATKTATGAAVEVA